MKIAFLLKCVLPNKTYNISVYLNCVLYTQRKIVLLIAGKHVLCIYFIYTNRVQTNHLLQSSSFIFNDFRFGSRPPTTTHCNVPTNSIHLICITEHIMSNNYRYSGISWCAYIYWLSCLSIYQSIVVRFSLFGHVWAMAIIKICLCVLFIV